MNVTGGQRDEWGLISTTHYVLSSEELAKGATSRSLVAGRRKYFLCGPVSSSARKGLWDGRWGDAGLRVQGFKHTHCSGFANIVCAMKLVT